MSSPSSREVDSAATVARRLATFLGKLDQWLSLRSLTIVGFLVAGLAVAKSGITGSQADVWSLSSWPAPVDMYPPLTYGMRSLAYLAGTESAAGYSVIGLLLIPLTVGVVIFLAGRELEGIYARWFVIMVLSGPLVWVLSGRLAHSDAFVLIGGALMGIAGRRLIFGLLGTFLAVLGSPEQAIVMSLALTIVSLVPRYRAWLRTATLSLGMSVFAWGILTVWATSLSIPTRASVLPSLIRRSLEIFLNQLPLTLYSGFGALIFVILWAVLCETRTRTAMLLMGAVLVPLGATAVTTDQTRVLVITSSAVVLALSVAHTKSIVDWLQSRLKYPLSVAFMFTLFLPALEVTGRTIRVPWVNYYTYLQAYLIDRIPLL